MSPQAISKRRAVSSYIISVLSGLFTGGFVFLLIALGAMGAQSNAEADNIGFAAVIIGFLCGLLVTAFVSKLIARNKDYVSRSCIILTFIAILIFVPPLFGLDTLGAVVYFVNWVYNLIF